MIIKGDVVDGCTIKIDAPAKGKGDEGSEGSENEAGEGGLTFEVK